MASKPKRVRRDANTPMGPGEELPQARLSQILLRMADPFIGEDPTRKDMQGLIALAALVWNAVVLEQEGEPGHELLLEHFRKASPEVAGLLTQIAEHMRHHKLDRHPSDRRLVVDWKVEERTDDFNVRVVSSAAGSGDRFAEAIKSQARRASKASGDALAASSAKGPEEGPTEIPTQTPLMDRARPDAPWWRRKRRPP